LKKNPTYSNGIISFEMKAKYNVDSRSAIENPANTNAPAFD
jgi:hypothetical protein